MREKRLDYYIISVMVMVGVFLSFAILGDGFRLEKIAPDKNRLQRYQFLKETEQGWLILDSEVGAICFIDARQNSNGSCKPINH